MTLLHPRPRSLVLVAIALYMTLLMGTVGGLNQGVTADSPANATVNVSAELQNVSFNESEPPDRPLVPDRFESNEPRETPGWLQDGMREIVRHTLHYANGIGHWAYYNKGWLPIGVLEYVFQFAGFVPIVAIGAAYRSELSMVLNRLQRP